VYEQHFGFSCRPFRNNADTRFFFPGGDRGAVVASLRYAITSGEGIVKVVGEVGSGKTIISRTLAVQLDGLADLVYLPNPSLTPDEVIHSIALELKLPVTPDASQLQVQYLLQAHLLSLHGAGRHVVVLIEEAQAMPRETLERVRLLSNLETERDKLMQIVLFGQPELDDVLARTDLRQLRERISHAFYLEPFSVNDVREYLNHRLHTAGYTGPRLFPEDVVVQIARGSRGSIRRINQIAEKTLLAAFAEGVLRVSRKHSKQALADDVCKTPFSRFVPTWPVLASSVAACAVATLVFSGVLSETVTPAPMSVANVAAVSAQPAAAPAPAVALPASRSAAKSLLAANTDWQASANLDQFTIQLITANGADQVGFEKFEQLFKRQQVSELAPKVRVFSGFEGERNLRIATFNAYDQAAAARAAIESLPEELMRYKPYVVRLRSVVNRFGPAPVEKRLSVTSLSD